MLQRHPRIGSLVLFFFFFFQFHLRAPQGTEPYIHCLLQYILRVVYLYVVVNLYAKLLPCVTREKGGFERGGFTTPGDWLVEQCA